MSLPKIALPTRELDIEGQPLTVRGLSRAEAHSMRGFGDDLVGAEAYVISTCCGVTTVDAAAWIADSPTHVVNLVLESVFELSGLGADGPKGLSEE